MAAAGRQALEVIAGGPKVARRCFLDSSVVVHAVSGGDDRKRDIALSLVDECAARRGLVLSTQVLIESYNVLVRKRRLAPGDAQAALRLLARHEVVVPSLQSALAAMQLSADHLLSPWDALIVQAAIQGRCDRLYSEDLQGGRRFDGVEIVNPLQLAAHEPLPAFGAAAPAMRRPRRPS